MSDRPSVPMCQKKIYMAWHNSVEERVLIASASDPTAMARNLQRQIIENSSYADEDYINGPFYVVEFDPPGEQGIYLSGYNSKDDLEELLQIPEPEQAPGLVFLWKRPIYTVTFKVQASITEIP